jgi:hypothetical protein
MRGPMLQMKYILTTRYDNVTLSPEQKRTGRGLRYRIYLTTGTRQNSNINSIKIMIRKFSNFQPIRTHYWPWQPCWISDLHKFGCGGHLGRRAEPPDIFLEEKHPMIILSTFRSY